MFSKTLISVAALTVASLANADTITDTSLNVTYTATSSFVPVSGNTYDVYLSIDATGFSQGLGYLDAVAMQFKTGSDIASVTLVDAPGGTSGWSLPDPGGLNKNGCDSVGVSAGDVCFQNNGANPAVPATGVYNFEFAVTLPGTDALTAASDIKAAYNAAADNSGKNLGLTSQSITIGQHADAPEPGTVGLLGAGLVGVSLMLKRKRRNLAV
jgi:hypothetical protein